jgi:maleamate amidohydrolase
LPIYRAFSVSSKLAAFDEIVQHTYDATSRIKINCKNGNGMTRDFEDHCWQDVVDEDTLALYRETWARETFVGDNPALIAVDLYNAVYEGGPLPVREADRQSPGSCGELAWAAIEPTKTLFAAARKAGIPIIHLTRASRPGVKAIRSTKSTRTTTAKNPHGFFPPFTPEPGELIIQKDLASGFFGTPLGPYLRKMGVESLIVCGESTSGCVRATVWEGYSHGFHVSVVEECCFDRSLLVHKMNLFDLHHKYADVMHLDEVLAQIEAAGDRRVA